MRSAVTRKTPSPPQSCCVNVTGQASSWKGWTVTDILDHTATMVALAIDTYRDRASAPTVRELAKDTGLGVATVHHAIVRLRDAGLVTINPRGRQGARTLRLIARIEPLKNGDVA